MYSIAAAIQVTGSEDGAGEYGGGSRGEVVEKFSGILFSI